MQDIADRIERELRPNAGWNDAYTSEAVKQAAIEMMVHDMDEETAEEVLHSLITALMNEMG